MIFFCLKKKHKLLEINVILWKKFLYFQSSNDVKSWFVWSIFHEWKNMQIMMQINFSSHIRHVEKNCVNFSNQISMAGFSTKWIRYICFICTELCLLPLISFMKNSSTQKISVFLAEFQIQICTMFFFLICIEICRC